MNKQIEEMARDIVACDKECVQYCHDVKCKDCHYFYQKEDCYIRRISEKLIAKGYRKASDVAREIFAEIEKRVVFNEYGVALLSQYIFAELKKKYESEGADDGR